VITQGGLTPTENTNTQLATAIRNMIKGDADKIVRVATTAPINLAAPGANIDGIAMVLDDTILDKDHATGALRGVYLWKGAAVPAVRATYADTGAELTGGMIVRVKEGTLNADTNWQLTTDGTPIIGTTALTFVDARYQSGGYLILRDERAIGADGGASIAGSQTRVLNTLVSNTIQGASLLANQITLPAGTYRINGSAPAFNTNDHVVRLFNVTDATNTLIGTAENATTTATDPVQTRSFISGKLTITSPKVFELRHFTELAVAGSGLGRTNATAAVVSVFTLLEIFKES
jgi:hypothetical protein